MVRLKLLTPNWVAQCVDSGCPRFGCALSEARGAAPGDYGGTMNKYIVMLGILLMAALPLLAQDAFPRGQVFGGYSYLSVDTSGLSGRKSLNGWNGQGSVNFNKWLGITGDFGGYYGSPKHVTLHDYSFLFGPTLTYRTEHVAPFFHALFGGNHINASTKGATGGNTAFAMAFGGGLDLPIYLGANRCQHRIRHGIWRWTRPSGRRAFWSPPCPGRLAADATLQQ